MNETWSIQVHVLLSLKSYSSGGFCARCRHCAVLCGQSLCQCSPFRQIASIPRTGIPNQILLRDWIRRPWEHLASKLVRFDERSQTQPGVIPALDTATYSLDCCDCTLTCPAHHQIDLRFKMSCAFAEDLDTILEGMDASGLVELLCSDGLGRIQKTTVDPMLHFVEVERDKSLGMDVGETAFGVATGKRGLTTFETRDGFAVSGASLLAFVTTSRGSTAAGGGTATKTFASLGGLAGREVA